MTDNSKQVTDYLFKNDIHIQNKKLCQSCCYNNINVCTAYVGFDDREKYGTDECPLYIDKNEEWVLIVYENDDTKE